MASRPKTRVVVGLSGGVDSSTAAALLVEQGYDVVGVTLKLWPQDCRVHPNAAPCKPQFGAGARAVCRRLGIPFYLLDEAANFEQEVIQYFAAEYNAGRTPNPCVRCNERLKFGSLLRRAGQLNATHVATGHYARLESRGDRLLLKRGGDLRRDQSYFLFSLNQDQLRHALFPLGDLTKEATRELAGHKRLETADTGDSMEICFVPDNDYRRFLRESNRVPDRPGDIVDVDGRVVGRHEGIAFYTIGQRRGLRIAAPHPLYVVALDPVRNRVVVGTDGALERDTCVIESCNWIPFEAPPAPFEAIARIRYHHPGAPATVTPLPSGRATVKFARPQRAITPGQACVLYRDDLVLGGGWIAS
ncbi:MAG: tRNA 2-thiouridine(34) synthase MnmA [Verrucomicrobia bacterium]|nr:tRNA 2-thiouridine(34) synthase MnmA [Verrucomicrobiota bacterium]